MNNGDIDFSGVDLSNSLGDDMIVVNEAEGKSTMAKPDTIDLTDNKSVNDENLNKTEKKSEKELEDLIEVIGKLRKQVPGIHIRTSLIAGLPNESDDKLRFLTEYYKYHNEIARMFVKRLEKKMNKY